MAVALTYVVQLLFECEAAGILRVAAVNHVAERLHRLRRLAFEPDPAHAFAINHRHLLARAQIADGFGSCLGGNAKGNAAARPTKVETEHQTRPFGRATMDK